MVLLGSATSSGSRQMVVSLSFTMNEETATVDFLCPTVDRATGTLRRLIHRVVLLCAAASYLLSLPLQVMFLGFLSLGETPKKRGSPSSLPFCHFRPKTWLWWPKISGNRGAPPSFRGAVREGEQGFQVVGKSCVRKGLVGVDLVEILAGRAEPPHGEGRHWRGRRSAMGPLRPPLADLWSLDRRRPPSLAEQGSCQPVGKPHIMSCHEDWDSRDWGTVE